MTWNQLLPALDTKVKVADDRIRDNWAAWIAAASREHWFDGGTYASAGQHIPSKVGVMRATTTAALSTYGVSSGSTIEGPGAFAYDDTLGAFKTWSGSAWVTRDFINRKGDSLTVEWTVAGSYIDGRDPSLDGAKIDSISSSADETTVVHGTIESFPASVGVPYGFAHNECHVFAHNCGVWQVGTDTLTTIACSTSTVMEASVPTGWRFHSQVVTTGPASTKYPTVYFIILGRKHST